MKLLLFISVLLLSISAIGQDDKPKNRSIHQSEIKDDFSEDLKFEHVDTILSKFYFKGIDGRNGLNNLGNPGQAISSMFFNSNQYGFHSGENSFNGVNQVTPSKDVLYRAAVPFARISYLQGPKKYRDFDVLFTESLNERFNFSIAYNSFGSTGFYVHQETVGSDFHFQNSFKTLNGAYGYYLNFNVATGEVFENGGIKSDSLYNELTQLPPFDPDNNKLRVQVWQEDAINRYDQRSVNFTQFYRIGSRDSTASKYEGVFLVLENRGFVNHLWYEDDDVDSLYYNIFNQTMDNGASIYDKSHVFGLRNKGFIKYQLPNTDLSVSGGVNWNMYTVSNTKRVTDLTETSVFGRVNRFKVGNYAMTGSFEKGVSGFNQEGYRAEGSLECKLFKDWLNFQVNANVNKSLPNYKFMDYAGSKIDWKNDFDYTNSSQLDVTLKMDSIGVELRGVLEGVKNYTYYSRDVTPTQYNDRFNTYRLSLVKKFIFHSYHFDVGVINQGVDAAAPVNLADWIVKASVYYQRFIFDKDMEIRYGVDYWQNTSYTANYYAPFTRSFVFQDQYQVGNFPYLNFYVSVRIKGAQGFVNFQNIGQFVFQDNYMMVPYYPIQDFGLSFGLKWDFYN